MKALLLGETVEAAALARVVRENAKARRLLVDLTSAVDEVRARFIGEVRVEDFPSMSRRGGVKGAEGLITALQWDRFRAVIEAAHPFDAETRQAAAKASRALGLPLLQLHRPLWPVEARGRVRRADIAEAAQRATLMSRVFLWIGLDRLAPFARRRDLWTLTRAFAPQPGRYPLPRGDYAVGSGPFTETHERMLLGEYRIGGAILENSGSALGEPTLRAAEALGLGVALIDPPAAPPPGPGGARVESVDAALEWLRTLS